MEINPDKKFPARSIVRIDDMAERDLVSDGLRSMTAHRRVDRQEMTRLQQTDAFPHWLTLSPSQLSVLWLHTGRIAAGNQPESELAAIVHKHVEQRLSELDECASA